MDIPDLGKRAAEIRMKVGILFTVLCVIGALYFVSVGNYTLIIILIVLAILSFGLFLWGNCDLSKFDDKELEREDIEAERSRVEVATGKIELIERIAKLDQDVGSKRLKEMLRMNLDIAKKTSERDTDGLKEDVETVARLMLEEGEEKSDK